MAFLALEKKNRKCFPISVCARERSFEAMFTEQRQRKPEGTVKTVSWKMRQFLPLLRQDLGQI